MQTFILHYKISQFCAKINFLWRPWSPSWIFQWLTDFFFSNKLAPGNVCTNLGNVQFKTTPDLRCFRWLHSFICSDTGWKLQQPNISDQIHSCLWYKLYFYIARNSLVCVGVLILCVTESALVHQHGIPSVTSFILGTGVKQVAHI